MKLKVTVVLTVVFCAVIAADAVANNDGALQKEAVSETATWVHHVNPVAFWQTDIGKHIIEELPGEKRDKIDDLGRHLGIRDEQGPFGLGIESLTFYGPEEEPAKEAVALIRGSFDQNRLLELLERNPEHKTYIYKEHTLHRYNDGKTRYGVFAAEDTIILSESKDAVKLGLDVFHGQAPDISDDERFAALTDVPAEAFSITCVHGVGDIAAEHGKSLWLKNVEHFCGYAVEQDGVLELYGHISARDAEKAEHMKQALRGMISLARLQLEQADGDFGQLIQAVDIEADGHNLYIDFKYSSSELLEMIRERELAN